MPNARVYKIVPASDWKAAIARGYYTGSPDDLRDGFIHLSFAHQVAGTLSRHFRNQEGLLLVAFTAAPLGEPLRFETSRGGDLFPHLYAPLPTGLALWQRPLQLDSDGVAVIEEDWLAC